MRLDKRSSVPLYAQLKDYLAEQIASGVYAPGEKIPTELALCAQLDLSRPTVRQAIAELVAEGSLYIVKGRGTFVTEAQPLQPLEGWGAARFDLFRKPEEGGYRRYIDYRKIAKPGQDVLRALGLPAGGGGGVLRVEWIEEAGEQPVAYSVGHFPAARYPQLLADLRAHAGEEEMAAHSAADALPVAAEATLALRPSRGEEARYLDISKAAPVFLQEAVFYNQEQVRCAAVTTVIRTDICTLHLPRTPLARD